VNALLFLAIILPALWAAALALPLFSKRFAGFLSALATFASFGCIFSVYLSIDPGQTLLVSLPWVPALGVDLSFLVDGLSLFFGFLVTGVGTLVNFYAQYYMGQRDRYLKRFYIYLNLFTTAMLGCVFADNLLLMFLFWELTGAASFLLIGYSFAEKSASLSARTAFLVTSLTAFPLLVGILMIGILNGTFLWTEVVTQGIAYSRDYNFSAAVIIVCFMIAIFGKSAQIPFHFWLPNAMCAPTPISAYLHAATMVKLGVFLTARMYPLFVTSEVWFPLLVSVSLLTMLIGALLSLLSNDLKRILAYATVSQLGFFISIYGMGDVSGVGYDFVHIMNHAFYKGSLFMLVGIINHATGIRDIRQLGGLWKYLPFTSLIFFVATLAMAGVPGTTGFISKELILKDLLIIEANAAAGVAILVLIVSASIFKVAFSIRLFYHLVLRKNPGEGNGNLIAHRPCWQVLLAPALLSFCALLLGIWPAGLERIVESFYVSGLHLAKLPSLKVWHGWTLGFALSIMILGTGALLFYLAERYQVWSREHPFPDFALLWNRLLESSVETARKWTLFLEGSSVHRHLASLLLLFAFGTCAALFSEGSLPLNGWIRFPESLSRWAAIVMILATALAVPFLSGGFSQVLALASSGFFVTLYFVFYKAPDLAMTQILVEVVTGIMLLVMVWVFRNEAPLKEQRGRTLFRLFGALVVAAAGIAISLAYGTAEGPRPLAAYFLSSSLPLAQGANAVNTILVDFRGLDTLGEATVLLIAAIGITGLVARREPLLIFWESRPLLIPSVILRMLAPPLFFMIQLFALYLLVRGHDSPGGGFSAGLAGAIAFVLVGFSLQFDAVRRVLPKNLLLLCGGGIAAILAVGLLPVFLGAPFLTHSRELPTALLFDAGIFIAVLGMTLTAVFGLRADALGRGGYGER